MPAGSAIIHAVLSKEPCRRTAGEYGAAGWGQRQAAHVVGMPCQLGLLGAAGHIPHTSLQGRFISSNIMVCRYEQA